MYTSLNTTRPTIIVVANIEKINNVQQLVSSHGIMFETGETIIVPPVHPTELGAVFNTNLGEYVIYD